MVQKKTYMVTSYSNTVHCIHGVFLHWKPYYCILIWLYAWYVSFFPHFQQADQEIYTEESRYPFTIDTSYSVVKYFLFQIGFECVLIVVMVTSFVGI